MAMYIDLILAPVSLERGGKMALWLDNCACHHVQSLAPLFDQAGIVTLFYPPNMTWCLQILDLVVNAPLKRNIRTKRIERIYDYFQQYAARYREERANNRKGPKWNPPKTELHQSLKDSLDLIHGLNGNSEFTTPQFKENIKKSFVNTGCAPIPGTNYEFVPYKSCMFDNCGTFSSAPTDATFIDDSVVDDIAAITYDDNNSEISEVTEADGDDIDDENDDIDDDNDEDDQIF